MKKIRTTILSFFVLAACGTIHKEESFLFDQVHYSERISKQKMTSEDLPRKSMRKVVVIRDSTAKIHYSTVRIQTRGAEGCNESMVNTVDTIKVRQSDHSFLKSESMMNGAFVRPNSVVPYLLESKRQLSFNRNGSCIESWVMACNDGGCSTVHQRIGTYRMIHDTLNVTYYLGRSWYRDSGHLRPEKEVEWHVSQPISYQFTLTAKSDSLLRYDEYEKKTELYLVSKDTVEIRNF